MRQHDLSFDQICIENVVQVTIFYIIGMLIMMRHASIDDFSFINSLVLSEAQQGHFDRQLLIPVLKHGWEIELQSVLANGVHQCGLRAYALIWEKNEKPIGFVIMSAVSDNKGNELWMASVLPEHRGGVARERR